MGRPTKSTAEIVPYTRDFPELIKALGHTVKDIRADNGATFRSVAFATHCTKYGITLRFTAL
jgi:transposase InsO family protein